MCADAPQDEPSSRRMTLHLARYPTPPTVKDVAALFEHLTGRTATPDDLARTRRILDESPSTGATTPGADVNDRDARRPPSREATRQRIVAALQRVTEEGGAPNFVILVADDRKNYYVQFATSCGSVMIYGEAVSNVNLPAAFALTPGQIAWLRRLGWRPPTRARFPNFHRRWLCITAHDREAIVDAALATLENVYRWRADTPLRIRLHLDW
jgi:hypothetical protein